MEINYQILLPEYILIAGLALTAVGLIRFYITVYARVYRFSTPKPNDKKPPVSVVLSGKNQYEALKKNITFWLEQKYPDFEVVVVYEDSDEDTAALLREFSRRYDKLVLINANQSINFFDEQKFSLSIGAKSSHSEIVIMTHPKFRPASEYCIDHIQAAFDKDTRIVVGHAVFSEEKKPFCDFLHYRILTETLQYTGFAIAQKAFTGRQCAIAYRKEFFLEHQGFSDSYALNCGGFDRFFNRIKKHSDVGVQIAPESTVKYTEPLSFSEMLHQEKFYRNTLAASPCRARKEVKAFRIFQNLYFLFLAAGVLYFSLVSLPSLSTGIPLWLLIFPVLLLVKYSVQAVIMQKAARVLGYGSFWFMLPLYGILSLFLQLVPRGGRKQRR